MSAIAGILDLRGGDVLREEIELMCEALKHRNSDGTKIWMEGPCGIAYLHFDEGTGRGLDRQPYVSEDAVVALDGRIENSSSDVLDPELVFECWRRLGDRSPVDVYGEFCFSIWDRARKRLVLARDVFGARALCYALFEGKLLFATEAKAILAIPGFPCRPDSVRMKEFQDFRFRSEEITFFDGIQRLPAAHYLTADSDGVRTQAYWQPDPLKRIRLPERKYYEEQFREIFFESVRSRLPESGPVGFTLSGGLDSSSILSVAAKIQQEERPGLELKAVSFRSRSHIDESPYIQMVLDQYPSIEHQYFYFEDFHPLKGLEEMIRAQETPLYNMVDAFFYELYGKVRGKGVKVMLVGEWGDQVFTGSSYLLDLLYQGSFKKFWKELHLLPPNGGGLPMDIFKRNIWYFLLPCRIQDRYEGYRYLLWKLLLPFKEWKGLGPKFPYASQRELYDGIFGTLNQMMLETLDRGAAVTGVSVRMPFLDQRLIEFLLAIPAEERVRDGLSKQVLRHGLRGILPDGIARRTDKGDFTDLVEDRYKTYDFNAASVEDMDGLWNKKVFGIWEDQWIKKGRRSTQVRKYSATAA